MSEQNHIEFGGPSSSGEYVVNVGGYDQKKFIPPSIADKIAEALGNQWILSNRGTRLEIMSRKFFYGYRDDQFVVDAVKSVIGAVVLLGDNIRQMRKFKLPMLLVLDEQASVAKGDMVTVKCAIIGETDDCWYVKPVESPHFDAKGFKNERFDQAHWRIAKTDPSAEPITDEFDVAILDDYIADKVNAMLSEMNDRMKKKVNKEMAA